MEFKLQARIECVFHEQQMCQVEACAFIYADSKNSNAHFISSSD